MAGMERIPADFLNPLRKHKRSQGGTAMEGRALNDFHSVRKHNAADRRIPTESLASDSYHARGNCNVLICAHIGGQDSVLTDDEITGCACLCCQTEQQKQQEPGQIQSASHSQLCRWYAKSFCHEVSPLSSGPDAQITTSVSAIDCYLDTHFSYSPTTH